ncbi:hypothetical protein H8A97_43265 [Bradyrhizobium sp. Arg62]|uniref:hypothetical protein n=1 Tax=Bradyrhizobium brasilense TaxID=1419277 RepID=UPI001E37B54E|nr:hypothetical protein [Bradyrhizobium brasilense]MCC8951663.1 hypothetical protein [Bradyrhizobium brasilense]
MAGDDHFAKGAPALLNWTLPSVFAATIAILFAWLLYDSSYGLTLVDEALYLNVIANSLPYAVNIPPFLFGFLSHWPYQWAGNDIAVLRTANVTPTMALGWICSFLVIRRLWMAGRPMRRGYRPGSPALPYATFATGCSFPGYCALSFPSLSMVMTGLLAWRPRPIRPLLEWILLEWSWSALAAGTFMAKPAGTTAIAVAVYVPCRRSRGKQSLLRHGPFAAR